MSEATTPVKRRGWGLLWLGLAILGVGGVEWLLVDEAARSDVVSLPHGTGKR